ncbi:anti-sigma-factor antagonist [Solidesulfovibrio fructosivorans JJ]]|uniref:Anti-sigma factor antagonist n=1 Tax=Solidesulfovibrio fructosivorans JJ] TaxID=596151 RepID=E1K2F4_SOLFR|nr:STAS domain-containing protein [Solidesulfovibrio fructosivorans]EFL49211.1 anti-sigma-factor antagonist [Solidesulfovibrio fructosivorans JJ]]
MQLVERENGGVTVLELGGRLDSNTSKVLEDKIMEILGQGKTKVLMDFKDVDYINSTGLRVLLLALQQLKKINGQLVLATIKDYMKEVFEISGYTEIFPIYPTQEEALAHFA